MELDKETFDNSLKRIDGSWFEMTGKFFFGGSSHREPMDDFAFQTPPPTDYSTHPIPVFG